MNRSRAGRLLQEFRSRLRLLLPVLVIGVVAVELASLLGPGIVFDPSQRVGGPIPAVPGKANIDSTGSSELASAARQVAGASGSAVPSTLGCHTSTRETGPRSCASSGFIATGLSATGSTLAAAAVHPPAGGAAMAYDVADGYVVLFRSGHTWTFSAGTWTELSLSTHPSSRAYPAITYDAKDGYVVLFGGTGTNSTGATVQFEDTWKFVAGHWTKLKPSSHPSPRYGSAMTYDGNDGEVVLFGGVAYPRHDRSGILYSDTWAFAGGNWTNVTNAHHPSDRDGEGLAFDTTDGYVVLFGGCGYQFGFCGNPLHDTWKFIGGAWTELAPKTPPGARGFMVFVDNPPNSTVLLFGGANETTALGGTWMFSAGGWTHTTLDSHPSPRAASGFAFDTKDGSTGVGEVVVFGGTELLPVEFGDTWVFVDGAWTKD
jgi:hypothetical protein